MRAKQWILDVVIQEGQYVGDTDDVEGSLWFVVACDGTTQPFSTIPTGLSERLTSKWDFPRRLILQVDDISRAYIFFTLCTYGKDGVGVIPIARSRICLRSLPIGSPKQFTFPMMSVKNSSLEVMQIKVLATLSLLSPTYSLAPSMPLHSQMSMGNPMNRNFYSSFGTH